MHAWVPFSHIVIRNLWQSVKFFLNKVIVGSTRRYTWAHKRKLCHVEYRKERIEKTGTTTSGGYCQEIHYWWKYMQLILIHLYATAIVLVELFWGPFLHHVIFKSHQCEVYKTLKSNVYLYYNFSNKWQKKLYYLSRSQIPFHSPLQISPKSWILQKSFPY